MKEYLNKRLAELGITEEENQHRIDDDSPRGYHQHPFFTNNAEGDIIIHYFDLYGEIERFESGRHRTERPYTVRRLANPKTDNKYITPTGTETRIYLTPSIIDKYARKTQIETLYIIEGQFKAFAGYRAGLDIVGISGIWNYRDKTKKKHKEELEKIISECQVKNIVLLFDADAREIQYKVDKDLATRLHSFHGAVRQFREICKKFNADTYYMQVREDAKQKGLDDLLFTERQKDNEAEVIQDIKLLESASTFFEAVNITAISARKLKELFFISDVKAFYTRYEEVIEEQEFIWNLGRYKWNDDKEDVEQLKHPKSFSYIRVGCEYYKKIQHVNSKGEIHETLEPWQISIIREDHVNGDGVKTFIKQIEKYDTFCNKPDNTEKHKAEIQTPNGSKNYNLYQQVPFEPKQGEYPVILEYLKHIFGTEETPSGKEGYILGLDYLTVLYRMPTQKLPILCLVSEDRGTGKSTLLYFLNILFGNNATICGNEDMQDSFNSHYISKLLCMIDEGMIDKKVVLEKIKSLSVSPRNKIHGKGKNKSDIDIFLKFIFTSNDEDSFIFIHPKETRFWVRKVNRFQGKEDPEILAKMTSEIPALLHDLATREIQHKKEGRMWFNPKHIRTAALEKVMKASKGSIEKEIREVVRSKMLDYMTTELALPYAQIETEVTRNRKWEQYKIINTLRDKMKIQTKNSSYDVYGYAGTGENRAIITSRARGRHYIFHATDFLTLEEIENINQNNI